MEQWFNLFIQGGSWAVGIFAAGVVGKQLIQYITKDKEQDRIDFREDKKKMYELMDKQNQISAEQKEMITQTNILLQKQVEMSSSNKEMIAGLKATMDKMNDIQMLHKNRLDRIEDRQIFMEREIAKIGDKLS